MTVYGGVDVDVSGHGERHEGLNGVLLHSVEQYKPATFYEAPVIGDFARHAGMHNHILTVTGQSFRDRMETSTEIT